KRRGGSGQSVGGGGELLGRGDVGAVVEAQVEPVVSAVLGNQVQFFHPIGQELPRLGHDVALRAAAMAAAHPRDDAKAARVVAAFGNLYVREMPRREPETRRAEVGDECGAGGDRDDWRLPI